MMSQPQSAFRANLKIVQQCHSTVTVTAQSQHSHSTVGIPGKPENAQPANVHAHAFMAAGAAPHTEPGDQHSKQVCGPTTTPTTITTTAMAATSLTHLSHSLSFYSHSLSFYPILSFLSSSSLHWHCHMWHPLMLQVNWTGMPPPSLSPYFK